MLVKILLMSLLLILVVAATPFLTIWSLNVLFSLGIEYTFWTWLGMVWLHFATFGSMIYNSKDK